MAASRTPRKVFASALPLAKIKATFSSVVDGVEQKRTPVTILRRGIAVAQIVPVPEEARAPLYGSMRGTVTELGDIISPTGEDWGMGDA